MEALEYMFGSLVRPEFFSLRNGSIVVTIEFHWVCDARNHNKFCYKLLDPNSLCGVRGSDILGLCDAFSNGAPGTPDPRTSKLHSETGLHAPKDHLDLGTCFRLPSGTRLGLPSGPRHGKMAPFQRGSSAQSSFGGKLTSEFRTPHSLQLLGLGKSFRLGPNKSVRFLEWHFSGRGCLSANLRGSFLTNGVHNGLQTPQGIRETLRKPRLRIPRSPPANDLRSRMAIQ
ncbi:hypothetical protein CRG98_026821 [Punica granatum]|uniref:Uncharacterized protein n=1 Tax=Punica granatum TaxID=22663 RepID=A0A2I0JAW6_PUNGR|nr:hypothetical protein CRG98_026821 [Punica granatum]